MQYNNGLKFSFSLRPKSISTSPLSTPKFPSISINQAIEINHPKQPIIVMQEVNIHNNSFNRTEYKGRAQNGKTNRIF